MTVREKINYIFNEAGIGDESKIASEEVLKEVNSLLKLECFVHISKIPVKNPRLFELIKDFYGRSVVEKLYNVLNPNERINKLKCPTCGKITNKFISFKKGYRIYCNLC